MITAPFTVGQETHIFNSAATAGGDVVMVGIYSGSATFGNTVLTSTGLFDGFVAKYRPATGAFVWALGMSGPGNDNALSVAVSGNNIYVAGNFAGPALGLGSVSVVSAGSTDGFIAKLTDTGNSAAFIWANRVGNGSEDGLDQVAALGSTVYVKGTFVGTIPRPLPVVISNLDGQNFVLKLTDTGPTGTFDWGMTCRPTIGALAAGPTGAYIGGGFNRSARFGSHLLQTGINGVYEDEAYVAKLYDGGTSAYYEWARSMGGTSSNDFVNALAVRGNSVYAAGSTVGTITDFGVAGTSVAHYAPTTPDVFFFKINDGGVNN